MGVVGKVARCVVDGPVRGGSECRSDRRKDESDLERLQLTWEVLHCTKQHDVVLWVVLLCEPAWLRQKVGLHLRFRAVERTNVVTERYQGQFLVSVWCVCRLINEQAVCCREGPISCDENGRARFLACFCFFVHACGQHFFWEVLRWGQIIP